MSSSLTLLPMYNEISIFFYHTPPTMIDCFVTGPKAGRPTNHEWAPPQWWARGNWAFLKWVILDIFLIMKSKCTPRWHSPPDIHSHIILSTLACFLCVCHLDHKHLSHFSFCFSNPIASSFHSCFLPITEFSEKKNDDLGMAVYDLQSKEFIFSAFSYLEYSTALILPETVFISILFNTFFISLPWPLDLTFKAEVASCSYYTHNACDAMR